MQPPADGDSELFCMHEPDVPLLNKVFERKTPPAILPGHADGQPQAGLTVAGLGPAAKVYFLRVAEQTSPAAYVRHVGRKDSGRFRLLADSRISSKGSSLWCDLCVVVWTSNM
jgi:hypothetical protein